MGKTPAKWLKNLLLGKKSSKSSPSKGSDVLKTSNKVEQVVTSTKLSVSDPTISSPFVGTIACNDIGLENQVPSNSQSNEVVCVNVKEPGSSSTQTVDCSASSEETEKLKLDQAATKAQSAFRGYAARREFRSQKCIIMLQAQIRGHLVRRQAVSTLCCVKGIVKFQSLIRRHKDAKSSNSLGKNTITKLKRRSKSSFVYKLRASLPSSTPLQLRYSSEDPNGASIWLDRWTGSRFWDPPSEPKKNSVSKSRKKDDGSRKTEAEQDKPKRSSRRLSENGSVGPTSDPEKGKHNPRKVSSILANTLQEHSPNKIDKAKRGPRKSPDPAEDGKPKQRTKKTIGDPAEKLKDIPEASPEQSAPAMEAESLVDPDSLPAEISIIGETEHDLDCVSNDNHRHNERRASLPANFDPQETGMFNNNNTPKRPSYMAPTESVKAKLRAQGSPRFSREAVEKNALMRRHSLSSSTNSMLSSLSPRVHRLVQSAGKGVLRGDRSFSSSRDGGDKLIQAEWRR